MADYLPNPQEYHQYLMETDKDYAKAAPDEQKAYLSEVHNQGMGQHPWVAANRAIQAGQRPQEGQEFPGMGRVPTKEEAAKDVAYNLAPIPVGGAVGRLLGPTSRLAPMVGRTVGGGVQGALNEPEDRTSGFVKGAGLTGLMEGGMAVKPSALPGMGTLKKLFGGPGQVAEKTPYAKVYPETGYSTYDTATGKTIEHPAQKTVVHTPRGPMEAPDITGGKLADLIVPLQAAKHPVVGGQFRTIADWIANYREQRDKNGSR